MTSGCHIDELEDQRRELEARRAMLEERFKLRLATAQVIGARLKYATSLLKTRMLYGKKQKAHRIV